MAYREISFVSLSAPTPAPAAAPTALRRRRQVDGRRLRSERTRHLIIEAYLDLMRLSPGLPTASQIAAHAGYSVRSIFERFSDLDALALAATDYALAVGQAEALARDVDGDRATRIRSQIATRAHACEKWLPLWLVLVKSQDRIPDLKPRKRSGATPWTGCCRRPPPGSGRGRGLFRRGLGESPRAAVVEAVWGAS